MSFTISYGKKMKTLKIILFIILGVIFILSIYYMYQYFNKKNIPKGNPPEIQAFMESPRENYYGKVLEIQKNKIKIQQLKENQSEIEVTIDDNTIFSKFDLQKNEPVEAKVDEITKETIVSVISFRNNNGILIAQSIDINQ